MNLPLPNLTWVGLAVFGAITTAVGMGIGSLLAALVQKLEQRRDGE